MNYINKEKVLKRVSQEEIFGLVFKEVPEEGEGVVSPFRSDKNPGCFFKYYQGKLIFWDYGNEITYKNKKLTYMDCFDAVMVYYKLPNFYATLKFIVDSLIKKKKRNKIATGKVTSKKSVPKANKNTPSTIIRVKRRKFKKVDQRYWRNYGINLKQLLKDGTYPVKRMRIFKKGKKDISINLQSLSYCFDDPAFRGRKKIYSPLEVKRYKFSGNCGYNDIGNYNNIGANGEYLIITKSYKDCRVIRNQSYTNTVWFQNEGSLPDSDTLFELVMRFKRVTVLYDNDEKGKKASKKTAEAINNIFPQRAIARTVPEKYVEFDVSDTSDMRKVFGRKKVKNFLKETIWT